MTSTPNPTWYDVLGVERDATPAQIKAAWRHATDRFEPGSGSGQFRMFNDAADVLLDPERRRAYDATLDPSPDPHDPGLDATPAPDSREELAEPPAPAVTGSGADEHGAEEPLAAEPGSEGSAATSPGVGRALVAALGRIRTVTLSVLAVLTVAVLVVVVLAAVKVHQQAAVQDARIEAPPAAEQATKALFSYDYRDLASERKRAQGYMTPGFASKYLRNFDALEKQKDGSPGLAVQTKAVVSATVSGSGVVDAEDGIARVLVFVNLVSRKNGGDPQIFQNRVAMTMQKEGDRWLVANVNSY